MIRERLKKKYDNGNKREKYKATFKRFGTRSGYKGEVRTILLIDIVDQRHFLVASHIWLDCGKQFDKINLIEGDRVQFHARVKIYEKGYAGYDEFGEKGFTTFDYGLSYPSKVSKLHHEYNIKKDN